MDDDINNTTNKLNVKMQTNGLYQLSNTTVQSNVMVTN